MMYNCKNPLSEILFLKASTFSTRFLALIGVVIAQLATVGPLVITSVGSCRSHSFPQATADTALLAHPFLIAFVFSQLWAVTPLVITSVGSVWSHSFTKTTTLTAMLSVLVAVRFGQLRAVRVLIHTRLGSCKRRICGSPHTVTSHRHQDIRDATHPDPSLYADEATLSPIGAPGVLNEPVINTVLST